MLGQLDASRTERLWHAVAISRNVSSVTHEQDDISSDVNRGQAVAAWRIAVSESLWQDWKSNSSNW
jgi:hypothetical protein